MENIKEWINSEPLDNEISSLGNGARFIDILTLEKLLDNFDNWYTQNFHYNLYKAWYDGNGIAASIELVIEYADGGNTIKRTFVGAANFDIKAISPNSHFLATVKSECIKNAASEIGKKFGRGLNEAMIPTEEAVTESNGGVKFVSMDEIKPENYAPKKSHIKNSNS